MSKVIVITGAGVGLGRALARRFASEGETVVLLGRTASKVETAAQEIGERAMGIGCDVANPDSVRAAFATIKERYGHVDVLINNAAVFEPFLIENATDDQIITGIGANLTGAIFCARSAIPLMGNGAQIINVSSESVEMPFPHLIIYQASKAGLERFSTALYEELQPKGIRVTYVRAGQMMEEGKVWGADPEAQKAFAMAAMAAGLNLRERPISQFESVTGSFRALLDLPADVQVRSITLHARKDR